MLNYGFEVELNSEHLCTAGIDTQHYVITCILSSIMRKDEETQEIGIVIGGLNSVTNDSLEWSNKLLGMGDVITIKVVDKNFDPPLKMNTSSDKDFILNQKIKYYYRLKEELKEYLDR
ncbi:hypothetical protein [Dyadobacter pollutisoli]|uniref:Uncharacterized protein n=1 Tax=Dyadobacter pollutisoli TaxID=2910158 RepID=A0A9E8N8C2_9BACT|nr:hypothetical protein [Dyadobacter pollutisoli]WAC09777.1 hypothetical protein ON006_18685 [Dyadobacter pollutisoli]